MKITDENIDASKTKCWCIFADQSFNMSQQISENGIKEGWEATKRAASKSWNWTKAKLGRATNQVTIGSKHNSLAFMEFSCKLDDGKQHNYILTFNYKKMRWYLLNAGLSVKNSDGSFPEQEQIVSFIQTKTFKTFIDSCAQYIIPWLKDTTAIERLLYAFQNVGGGAVNLLKFVLNNKENISVNMFDMNVVANHLVNNSK